VRPAILIRRFIDWDLRRKPVTTAGNLTLLVGMMPWFLALLLRPTTPSSAFSVAAVMAIIFDVIWFGFVGWRALLLFRAFGAKGDRLYDSAGKYVLPPEYAKTESATKARRRRRNGS
jgi:hypothetical protein